MATTPPSTTPTTQALLGALADRPGATAAELAAAAGIGRSTAGKLLATLTAQGRVVRQPGGHQDGRRTADRWLLLPGAATNTAQADNPASAATPPIPTTATADPDQARAGPGRLGPGELRGLVLACLADRADQALSPTGIAKGLGRSAGAVGNALRVLAGQGAVVQTQTRPRRYAIAEGGDQADPPG